MKDLVRLKGGSDGLMGWGFGDGGLGPAIFAQDIELITLPVAGTRYHQAIAHIEELEVEQVLELRREPENRHDEWAIAVRTSEQVMLGYIPRDQNGILARLMDAGKLLVARIDAITPSKPHEKSGYDPGPEILITVIFRDV